MKQNENGCFPTESSKILSRKPGFYTLDELKQQKELFSRMYGNLDGQLLLIEVNYLERTHFGGPGADLGLVESTGYILGVIDSSVSHGEAVSDKMLVPVAKHVKWEKYASIFDNFVCSENLLCLDTHYCFALYGGRAQYNILVGNLEVTHAICRIELNKQQRGLARQLILNFWSAAKAIGVDTSDSLTIAHALEAEREVALREYVQVKIDSASSKANVRQEGALVFVELKNLFPDKKLLLLGLSEEAIAYRAKELALVLLNF